MISRLARKLGAPLAFALVALTMQAARGQTATKPGAESPANSTPGAIPTFDVVAIHLHKPLPHEHSHIVNTNGRFVTVNQSLKAIIEWAYDIPGSRVMDVPESLSSARFDIDAKSEETLDTKPNADAAAAQAEKRSLVRALLADRFHLVTHAETRELPIFALVVAKGGVRFLDSKAEGTSINSGKGYIQINGGDDTVALLADWLAEPAGRLVVDKTGITGRYSISLKWTPDDLAAVDSSAKNVNAPDQSEPPLFTAIQEQLGLKLEPGKAPVPVLVVDHAEMPTEN